MVVLDANVVVALAVDDERAVAIEPHIRGWKDAGDTLHAPSLLRYEVASALTRNVVAGRLESNNEAA